MACTSLAFTLLLGLSIVCDFTYADALPDDTLLSNLGEAILHIQKDILILPNAQHIAFKDGTTVSDSAQRAFPTCSIQMREAIPRARVFKAGARDIQLTGAIGSDVCHQGGCWIHLVASASDHTVESVLCAESMDHGQQITLKTLLEAFGGYVVLETPVPSNGLGNLGTHKSLAK